MLPSVTIELGDIIDGTGTIVTTGSAVFTPTGTVTILSGINEIIPAPVSVQLTEGGATVPLIPTDIDGASPAGWGWQVAFAGVPGSPAAFTFKCPAGPFDVIAEAGIPGVFSWTPLPDITEIPNGTGIQFTGTSMPGGITSGVTYYATGAAGSTFSVAATVGGSPVTLTSPGADLTARIVSYLLSAVTPVTITTGFGGTMPAPGGTALTGMVPVATGSGNASAWSMLTAAGTGADPAGAAASAQAAAQTYAAGQAATAQASAQAYTDSSSAAAVASAHAYADTAAAAAQAAARAASLNLAAGGTVAGPVIFTGEVTVPAPVSPGDAVTKSYADALSSGLSIQPAVNVAAPAALPSNTYSNGSGGIGATLTATANGALVIDTVTVSIGDRILVPEEATAANNGLYTVTATGNGSSPWVLTRADDMNTGSEVPGTYVFVEEGTPPPAGNQGTGWVVTGAGPFTIGTTPVNWAKFNAIPTPVSITSGGTGATTRQAAINALAGGTPAGQYLRGNGSNVIMSGIVAGDVPQLNQNTTGTAGGLSGTPALPNGTTATTQAPGDNTAKVATTAFVTAASAAAVTTAETGTMPAPGGTNTAGYIPYATGTGSASTWGPAPSGSGGGGGGALATSSVISSGSAVTGTPGNFYLFDVTANNCQLNLPAAPADKTQIGFMVIRNAPATGSALAALTSLNTLTVKANNGGSGTDQFGDDGTVTVLTLDQLGQGGTWQYNHTAKQWYQVSGGDLTVGSGDSRYPRIVNVQGFPFYAKGDNVTADTNALQGAINVATALGVPAYFPPGQYRTGSLTLPQGAVLQGSNSGTFGTSSPDAPGYPVSILCRIAGTNDHLLKLAGSGADYQRIIDLAIDGNKNNNTFGFGIYLQDSPSGSPSESQVLIERCFIHDNPMSGIYLGSGRRGNKVINSVLTWNGSAAAAATTAAGGGSGSAQWSALCDGITVVGSDNTIQGGIFGGNYRAGICLGTTATQNWAALSLSGYSTSACAVAHIHGNDMYSNLVAIAVANGSSDCTITQNAMDRHALQAITVYSGASNSIVCNSFHSNAGNASPANGAPITTAGSTANLAHIDVFSGVTQVCIDNNNFGPQDSGWPTQAKYCVYIGATSARVLGNLGAVDPTSFGSGGGICNATTGSSAFITLSNAGAIIKGSGNDILDVQTPAGTTVFKITSGGTPVYSGGGAQYNVAFGHVFGTSTPIGGSGSNKHVASFISTNSVVSPLGAKASAGQSVPSIICWDSTTVNNGGAGNMVFTVGPDGIVSVLGASGAAAGARFCGGTVSGAPTTGTWSAGDFVIDQTGRIWIYNGTAWVQPAAGTASLASSVSFAPPNPAATVSTSVVMMGLGAATPALRFTPTGTGIIRASISGFWNTATAAATGTIGCRYGTGTAPANGAASTGTQWGTGSADAPINSARSTVAPSPFSFSQVITGLVTGTPVWFDLVTSTANASDAATITNVQASFQELAA